jgi:hypothetical protein
MDDKLTKFAKATHIGDRFDKWAVLSDAYKSHLSNLETIPGY